MMNKLMQLKKESDSTRRSLRIAVDEVVNDKNYNKIRKIEKILEKQLEEFASIDYSKVRDYLKNVPNSEKYKQSELRNPRNIINNLNQIKEIHANLTRLRKEKQEEQTKNNTTTDKTSYVSTTQTTSSPSTTRYKEESSSKNKPIKNEIYRNDKSLYITSNQAEEIANTYNFNNKYGFFNKKNLKSIIEISSVEKVLSSGKDKYVDLYNTVECMSRLYYLAVEEATYLYYNSENYSEIAKFKNEFGSLDFVERYTRLYNQLNNYISRLPEEERKDALRSLELNGKYNNGKILMTPEEFRNSVNKKISEKVVSDMFNFEDQDQLKNATKYMDAQEIANLYEKIEKRDGVRTEKVQEAYATVIASRMNPLDMEDENYRNKLNERLIAICREYFSEEPIFIDASSVNTNKTEAKKMVESYENIISKKKEYFRMSKFEQMLAFMDFKKLKKLSNKDKLTEEEITVVKGMF